MKGGAVGMVSGREAVAIVVREIGIEIGNRRLLWFEKAVRTKVPPRATGRDWLLAIAQTIVEHDDTAADRGFQRGMTIIRAEATKRTGR